MNKFKIHLVIASFIGLLGAFLYSHESSGHGKYASISPRIAVGLFVCAAWYLAFYLGGKIKTSSALPRIALLIIALLTSIWAVFYPSPSAYWY